MISAVRNSIVRTDSKSTEAPPRSDRNNRTKTEMNRKAPASIPVRKSAVLPLPPAKATSPPVIVNMIISASTAATGEDRVGP